MLCAMRVKSPFSHSALFGFVVVVLIGFSCRNRSLMRLLRCGVYRCRPSRSPLVDSQAGVGSAGLEASRHSRPALVKARRGVSRSRQLAHGLVCEGTERSAAVGDDLAIARQLREVLVELVDGDRARALD